MLLRCFCLYFLHLKYLSSKKKKKKCPDSLNYYTTDILCLKTDKNLPASAKTFPCMRNTMSNSECVFWTTAQLTSISLGAS